MISHSFGQLQTARTYSKSAGQHAKLPETAQNCPGKCLAVSRCHNAVLGVSCVGMWLALWSWLGLGGAMLVLVVVGRCWSLLVVGGRCWSLLVVVGRCWSWLVV
eukprot:14765602-Alexandrium_andersonii.AAC.1